MSGGFGSVPWGGEQLVQMSVGAPPPAGNAYNAPHALESCAATHRPSGETLNAKRFDVGTIFCSSPLSSLTRWTNSVPFSSPSSTTSPGAPNHAPHLKIWKEALALSRGQVRDPEAAGDEACRSRGADQVIQLLAIGRDGWAETVALRRDLPVAL